MSINCQNCSILVIPSPALFFLPDLDLLSLREIEKALWASLDDRERMFPWAILPRSVGGKTETETGKIFSIFSIDGACPLPLVGNGFSPALWKGRAQLLRFSRRVRKQARPKGEVTRRLLFGEGDPKYVNPIICLLGSKKKTLMNISYCGQ